MTCAVIVPTRDRPEDLKRALVSFIQCKKDTAFQRVIIIVSDDSRRKENSYQNRQLCNLLSSSDYRTKIFYVPPCENGIHGAGLTRNRGMMWLKESKENHNSLMFFDDDMSFTNCIYQNKLYLPEGKALLKHLSLLPRCSMEVWGCDYIGRQDLSMLEHLKVHLSMRSKSSHMLAGNSRAGLPYHAPGGISGGFLYLNSSIANIPYFLNIYNEDYMWLKRMEILGWKLKKKKNVIVHAPNSKFEIETEPFINQQVGEVLWQASMIIEQKSTVSYFNGVISECADAKVAEIRSVQKEVSDNKQLLNAKEIEHVLLKTGHHLLSLTEKIKTTNLNNRNRYELDLFRSVREYLFSGNSVSLMPKVS